jgi:hypothetical protein
LSLGLIEKKADSEPDAIAENRIRISNITKYTMV